MDFVILVNPRPLNVLYRRRKATDILPLFLFGLYLLLWFAIAAYAYYAGDTAKVFPPDTLHKIAKTLTVSRVFIIIGCTYFTGLGSLGFIWILQRVRNISYLTLLALWIPCAAWVLIVALYSANVITGFCAVIAFCSAVLTYYLIHTEWLYLTEAIIKESCKVIKFFPMAIIFALVWYPLCLLVLVFGATVHFYLKSITLADNTTSPDHIALFTTVNVLGIHWLLMFVFKFGQMVLGGAFATWFWKADKDGVSINAISRFIKLTIRYHLGTLAYNTSAFGLVEALFRILRRLRERIQYSGISAAIILLTLYNCVIDMVVVKFTVYNTCIVCAIFGKGFYISVENTLGYLSRHTRRCLMMSKMIECILLLGILFVSMFMLPLAWAYIRWDIPSDELLTLAVSMVCCSLVFVLPMAALLVAALSALFLCCLEDSERNDGSERRPYLASPELRAAMLAPRGLPCSCGTSTPDLDA